MWRGLAAGAAAMMVAFGSGGCALSVESVDPAVADAPDTWHGPPTTGVPAPFPAPGAPPAAGVLTPAPTTSGPLPTDMDLRIDAAQRAANARGADISVVLLDRSTGERFRTPVPDSGSLVETASVAKLFIADEVLHASETPTDEELDLIGRMLEDSDDDAANVLWFDHGGSTIVDAVAARYGLEETSSPWDDNWWNTLTTADDLVDYYAELLDGRGDLSADATATILSHLRASAPVAADGYDQRFGIPDALTADTELAVKQGWMCCVDTQWVHLSTAVAGPDARYVLVVVSYETVDYEDDPEAWSWSRQDPDEPYPMILPDTSLVSAADDVSAAHARQTITDVVRILFPERRIG